MGFQETHVGPFRYSWTLKKIFQLRGLHYINPFKLQIPTTDNCLETTISNQKRAQLRWLHGLTVMKGLQKQKHLITIISFLLLATSTMLVLLLKWQPPLKRLPWGAPSCPDRGIFSSICPWISMSHLSMMPFIPPQRGTSPVLTLIQLSDLLMTPWPPVNPGYTFSCTWCEDACLPVAGRGRCRKMCSWLHVVRFANLTWAD